MSENNLTHFDGAGNAVMVDVSAKPVTAREATAHGIITMNALSSLPELTTMIGDAPWVQCAEYADTGSISCVGINDVEAAQGAVSRLADGGRRLLGRHVGGL